MVDRPIAIVTGASRGIGAAVARWLATQGAGVTITARSTNSLSEVADEIRAQGGEPLVVTADVSDYNSCRHIIAETKERFGRLDALVNNAGIIEPIAPIAEADPSQWKYNIDVNLVGPFYLTQLALPLLRERNGRVINVSTGAAVNPSEGWSAYCASKAGLLHLTRVIAVEEPAITALSLRPGVVDTEMQTEIRRSPGGAMPGSRREHFRQLKEEGELEPPDVPARAIAWLALHAPNDWSGEFMQYDDPRVAEPASRTFDT